MVVAYLRVSTEKQFLANQREEILRFAEKNELVKLAGVLNRMRKGDTLIVTEISRLSRTMLEIMTILNSCIKKNIILYSTKEGYIFQNDINSKVLGFAFGLMAEIERNLISMRTKEAFAERGATWRFLFGTGPSDGCFAYYDVPFSEVNPIICGKKNLRVNFFVAFFVVRVYKE